MSILKFLQLPRTGISKNFETFESCFVVVKSSITFSDFSIETKTKHIGLFHYS